MPANWYQKDGASILIKKPLDVKFTKPGLTDVANIPKLDHYFHTRSIKDVDTV
jgi:hypothetical protein